MTARLFALEPLCQSHAAPLFAILADPELWSLTDSAPPVSVEEFAARYRRLESRRSPASLRLLARLAFAIEDARDPKNLRLVLGAQDATRPTAEKRA